MHRRFLFPLAAGVVGLVAISPVLAAEPSTPTGAKGPAKAATTTSSKGAMSSTMSSSSSGSGPSGGSGASSTTATGGSAGTTATTASTSAAGKGGSTATTAPPSGSGSGGGSSTSTCGAPTTDQGPAPQMGEAPQNHGAGDAGTVDVERMSPTELRIAKANANNGWMQQVTAPSGTRVSVKFTRQGQSPSLIRFAGSMDQAGRIIHIRVTSCG